MSKRQQLEMIKEWQLPTPRFTAVRYEDFQKGAFEIGKLRFPVAVRSSYADEDGDHQSMAGQFKTVLQVEPGELEEALEAVFNSYPNPEGSEALVQEMVDPEFSGVLFAFRESAWKLELIEGQGDALMSGHKEPETILLPRFQRMDAWAAAVLPFWKGFTDKPRHLNRALIWLSYYTQVLLERMGPEHGLDIEFCIRQGRLLLLQARPITTPEEAEEVLTSANHKEILPPEPSPLMTAVISSAGYELFNYYRELDPSLPPRAFLREAAGMPWINLSALLDVMVHWGLPTSLVCRSVGAEDFYQVGLRPHRALSKLPVFLKALGQQSDASGEVRDWVHNIRGEFAFRQKYRGLLWENNPQEAFEEWLSDFRQLYIGLVTNMQILTGAMSGPVSLLDKLGILPKLSGALQRKSASTDYLQAFNYLKTGMITRDEFLARFGHRGFYESDIGQKRFYEYTEAEWRQLLPEMVISEPPFEYRRRKKKPGFWEQLFSGLIRLIHTREWLRDEAMKLFWQFRKEMLDRTSFPFWKHRPEVLAAYFAGEYAARSLKKSTSPSPAGWDMDTFLCNRHQRRLPLQVLANIGGEKEKQHTGIGIYPGKVEGRVWRLSSANLEGMEPPPFEKTILVADALDPGWVPYFLQVDGVISYVGGLLSHASIILRESRIPAITQLPVHITLETGDWIEMNGQTGEVIVLSEREDSLIR